MAKLQNYSQREYFVSPTFVDRFLVVNVTDGPKIWAGKSHSRRIAVAEICMLSAQCSVCIVVISNFIFQIDYSASSVYYVIIYNFIQIHDKCKLMINKSIIANFVNIKYVHIYGWKSFMHLVSSNYEIIWHENYCWIEKIVRNSPKCLHKIQRQFPIFEKVRISHEWFYYQLCIFSKAFSPRISNVMIYDGMPCLTQTITFTSWSREVKKQNIQIVLNFFHSSSIGWLNQ